MFCNECNIPELKKQNKKTYASFKLHDILIVFFPCFFALLIVLSMHVYLHYSDNQELHFLGGTVLDIDCFWCEVGSYCFW